MNTEDYVSYEQAKKLKELGFDWRTIWYYEFEEPTDDEAVLNYTASYNGLNNNMFDDNYSAPTLAEAAKWLREIHKLSIRINYSQTHKNWFFDILNLDDGSYTDSDIDEYYSTYEKALSAGLDAALELLIK